jgi:hypothetical protein
MVNGIMASLKVVVWAMMVLFLIDFNFAVVIAIFIQDEKIIVEYDDRSYLMFHSLGGIMSGLFMSVTGGVDWIIIAGPLTEINIFLGIAFAFYVSLSMFVVFNVITGLVVEYANNYMAHDEDEMFLHDTEDRQAWNDVFESAFRRVDADGSGSINQKEFLEMVSDERSAALFRKLGIDVRPENATRIFRLLGRRDGPRLGHLHKELSFDEFKAGIYRIQGSARSIDIATLLVRTAFLAHSMKSLMQREEKKAKQNQALRVYRRGMESPRVENTVSV